MGIVAGFIFLLSWLAGIGAASETMAATGAFFGFIAVTLSMLLLSGHKTKSS